MPAPQPTHSNKSAEQVAEMRRRFLEDVKLNPELYDDEDVQRVKDSDWWTKRYLLVSRRNVDAGFKLLRESMRWRRSFGVNSLTASMFPREYFEAGGLFPYKKDINGYPLIYMRVKLHLRIPEFDELLRKYIVYTLDKVDRETDSGGMGIVFDCSGAGLANADMELLKFVIVTLQNHFPKSLKYVLIYEMPWVLNTIWKMARAWLPADSTSIIKTASKKDITNYIPRDNLPDFMNGPPDPSYRCAPKGALSGEQIALKMGMSPNECKKIMTNLNSLIGTS